MGRGNGVRRASKTTIEIDLYYRRVRCKERLKLKPSPSNLKRAERHRAAVLDAIERGTFEYAVTFPSSPRAVLFSHEPGPTMTLSKDPDRWLNDIRPSLKASTFTNYKRIVNHQLVDQFGELPLTQIAWKNVRDWLARKDASAKTKGNILSVMRTDKRWTGDMVIRQRMWKRILTHAGVRYRCQMRHTYASMMLQAGESVMWVTQQMGHTDWTFTAQTYSRWVSIDAPEAGSLAAKKWG